MNGKDYKFQMYTGFQDNICDQTIWKELSRPKLHEPDFKYTGASDEEMKVLGKFMHPFKTDAPGKTRMVKFVVVKHPLNLLDIAALHQLQINIDPLMHATCNAMAKTSQQLKAITTQGDEAEALQKACQELCTEFSDLFKPELGCLKDYELEAKFKPDTKHIYCKLRTVPLALLNDLNKAYEAGIKKGIWVLTQFNEYGTHMVPIRKAPAPGQKRAKLCVYRNY